MVHRTKTRQPSQGLAGATASMIAFKLLSNAAVVGVGVITARQLHPTGRGTLVLMVTIASFGVLISSLGVNVAARVHLVAKVSPIPSGEYFGLTGALVILQLAMCTGLGLTLLPVVGVRLSALQLLLFTLMGASLLGQYLLTDALNAYGFTTLFTTVDAAGSAMQLFLVFLLSMTHQRDASSFVAALLAAGVFQALLALVALRHVGVRTRPSYDRQTWKLLLRKGLYGIPTALGQSLTFRIDRYLIGFFLNPAAVAVYSVAASAPELLRLPALALGQPIAYRLASGSASLGDFRRVRNICLALTAGMAGVVALAAPTAIRVVFGPEYLDAVTPLRLLLLGELGIAAFNLDGALLVGADNIKAFAKSAMLGLIVVSVLDIALIPIFGLAGAAWASVAAYSAMGTSAALFAIQTRRTTRAVHVEDATSSRGSGQ